MPLSKWKMQLAFGSAILTLLVTAQLSYRTFVLSLEGDRWTEHTHTVLEKIDDLLLAVRSNEAAVPAFLLLGEESCLDLYGPSILLAKQDLSTIGALTVDNPTQQRQIPVVNALLAARVRRWEEVIGIRRRQGLAAAVAAAQPGTGRRVTYDLQAALDKMKDEELRLLALRDAGTKSRLHQSRTLTIFGTVLGLLITCAAGWSALHDSSARGLAEKALLEREELFRDMANNISQLAWMADKNGCIFWYNQRWFDYSGTTLEEMAGWGWQKVHHPDYLQRVVKKLSHCFLHGKVWEDTFPLRGRDGGYRWFLSRAVPIRDAHGAVLHWFGTNTDISGLRESENHLAQMEARYRGLLEAAPDAMVVVNQGGEIVLLNVQAEKQFGYSRDELVGQKVTNIIPEGFAERLIADGTRTAAQALAQQIGMGIELTGRRKDGSGFPIEIMLSPLESAEGILVTAAVRDITVRKAAEEHLAQMEARYRGLLEAAPDAMVVVNQGRKIVLLNVQVEKQFGYSREELVGQKVTNIIPEGFAERLIADGARTAAQALEQQIGMGIELTGRRKDGSGFPIEIMLSPLESADGILITAAVRDITVRKAAEEHLAQMEARYRGLLEAAPDAMVVVNQGGEIVLLNLQAEKQFGYSRDELVGQKVTNIIPEGFAERLIADGARTAAQALEQQIGMGIELTGRRKDGSGFPIEIMLSPLESAEGILVTAAVRDITTRKRAESQLVHKIEELNRSNAELEQFASLASHDLQEPLRMVGSYTQLLSKRYKGKLGVDADEFIGFAVDGANRMQRLIQDLLLYSRVGTGGVDLLDTSSEEALRQAIKNLRGSIEESGALVTHDPLPIVQADERQLTQLFQNLVGNAIKYQRPGIPRVHISATRDGKKWMFSVKDNGLGIEPRYFEKIFVMFQRLHKREEFTGTGIGLAICKKIVERHGGRISIESQLGQGSTFHFALAESKRVS